MIRLIAVFFLSMSTLLFADEKADIQSTISDQKLYFEYRLFRPQTIMWTWKEKKQLLIVSRQPPITLGDKSKS